MGIPDDPPQLRDHLRLRARRLQGRQPGPAHPAGATASRGAPRRAATAGCVPSRSARRSGSATPAKHPLTAGSASTFEDVVSVTRISKDLVAREAAGPSQAKLDQAKSLRE